MAMSLVWNLGRFVILWPPWICCRQYCTCCIKAHRSGFHLREDGKGCEDGHCGSLLYHGQITCWSLCILSACLTSAGMGIVRIFCPAFNCPFEFLIYWAGTVTIHLIGGEGAQGH